MSRKKKKTKTGPRFQWLRSITINWSSVWRAGKAALWLLGLGGIAAASWYGVPELEAHARLHSQPEEIEIYFDDAPAWAQHELNERLVEGIEPLLTDDPFNREELEQIRIALLNTGWFERIDQVRRVRSDRIDVHGTYVDPYAVVRDREGDHLVDPRGKLLPRTYPTGEAQQFIAIIGNRFPRPGRPGMQWEGSDINAALRLLELIERQQWRDQVVAINIHRQVYGEPMRIVTDRGSRIIWGSPPGEEAALEALADRKLYYLDHLYEQEGRIDMGYDGELDITSTTSIDHRQ